MSDNLRRYRAIHRALAQCYEPEPSGRMGQHLTTLAAFISGIVGGKSCQLPSIAAQIPDRAKPESRVKRLSRWLDNSNVLEGVYFLPHAEWLLHQLALATVILVMDGSGIGRGCCALMIHVIYKGRALPLAWRVRQSPKGHFPEAFHIALVELVRDLIPPGTRVVFLGDGEFDGVALQQVVTESGWDYVCRTAKSTQVTWGDETFALSELGACLKPGQLIDLQGVAVTREAYGPVMVLCGWGTGYAEPLYLVTNLTRAEEAIRLYHKRFRIETFFSDQKSRGFHLNKSRLSDPHRLSRLLIAACLAYLWIVYLGAMCEREGWRAVIHRAKRCDLSLFQLGLRLLQHFLNEGQPIPVHFHVTLS